MARVSKVDTKPGDVSVPVASPICRQQEQLAFIDSASSVL